MLASDASKGVFIYFAALYRLKIVAETARGAYRADASRPRDRYSHSLQVRNAHWISGLAGEMVQPRFGVPAPTNIPGLRLERRLGDVMSSAELVVLMQVDRTESVCLLSSLAGTRSCNLPFVTFFVV